MAAKPLTGTVADAAVSCIAVADYDADGGAECVHRPGSAYAGLVES